jgi:type IV secretion system protein VirD4
MSRKRLLLTFAAVCFVLTALGFTVATQYAASKLGYQKQLGEPLIGWGVHVYAPWSWLTWASDFGPYAPAIFRTVKFIGWSVFLVTCLPLVVTAAVIGRRKRESTAHGSASWASTRLLEAAGMLSNKGVVLCQTDEARYVTGSRPGSWRMTRAGRLITHDGPEHVIVFAPTRSGKGIGTVIPTLLNWRASALIYDIKKELWTLTSGYRRQFSRCWRFEPIARDSIRFNPLLEIRRGDGEVRDVQNIADILVDPEGSSEKRDHWKTSASTLLVGSILHIVYAEKDKSLSGVARFLSNPASPIMETFQRMLSTRHLTEGPHPVVAQCAREMMDKSDNELAGIVSTAKSFLNLYNDPLIERNTSASDFRISDLMNGEDPVSLYLVVPPSDIDRTRPLIRLMLNQIGRRLTERMEFGDKPAYRHRLLFLLDEFPSLGKLSFFQTQLAYLAGYGIKAYLIAQSLNQLQAVYGQDNSILDNCHVRMTYTALDDRTAKRISDLIGQMTHTKLQRSYSGGGFFRNVNDSEQEHARALLTPDEILRLPYEDAILLVGGIPPYRARKLMYYLDPRFKEHTKRTPPDSERQRRNELLPSRAPSDWEQLVGGNTNPVEAASPQDAAGFAPDLAVSHANPEALPSPSVPESSRTIPPADESEALGTFAAFFEAEPAQESPGLVDTELPPVSPDDELPL